MNFKTSSIAVCLYIIFIGTFCNACITYIPVGAVSGGEEHSLILTQDGVVYSCGDNGYSQLGDGTNYSRIIPVQVNDVNYSEVITDISAGWQHSLLLGESGRVFACGSDSYGCLGNGSGYPTNVPAKVLTGEQNSSSGYLEWIIDIAAGRSGEHSLAVDSNNMCYAWGRNYEGQLGNNSNDSCEVPVKVLGGQMGTTYLQNIIAVSAGEQHSMALEKLISGNSNCQGRVYTFGDNDHSKLGINDANGGIRTVPMMVRGVGGVGYLTNIVEISAGWDHCMAIENWDPFEPNNGMGRVYAWGNNGGGYWGYYGRYGCGGGRLGNGNDYGDACTPVIMLCGEMNTASGYLEGIQAISAGESHSMMLDASGYVYCVGSNKYGQLGNGTNTDSLTPVRVKAGMQNPENPYAPLSNIVYIAAGYWHNLAVDDTGMVWVWGEGVNGKLGYGSTADTNLPVPLALHDLNVHNQTQNKWYKKIQPAINEANDNDVIVPYEGYYCENVNFDDKTIVLKSIDPNMLYVVDNTRIYGSGQNVISLTNNYDSEIDGITVTNGSYGIYCDYSNPIIKNCIVKENQSDGIHCQTYSWPDILNTIVQDNSSTGIYSSDSDLLIVNCDVNDNQSYAIGAYGSAMEIQDSIIKNNNNDGVNVNNSYLTVTKCTIENNYGDGIDNSSYSYPTIQNNVISQNKYNGISCRNMVESEFKNNWIVNNGEYGGSGIYIESCSSAPKIFNNTIAGNYQYGINRYTGIDPNVINCIIWGNSSGSLYGTFSNINYTCIQGGHTGTGNTSQNPQLSGYHLTSASTYCINTGNPNYTVATNETDINGDCRIMNSRVDMGADEFNPYDITGLNGTPDGTVNFFDFASCAKTWRKTQGQTGYNDLCDFYNDNVIDFQDMEMFCEYWLAGMEWSVIDIVNGVYFYYTPSGCGYQMLIEFPMFQQMGALENSAVIENTTNITSSQLKTCESEYPDVDALVNWLDNLWENDKEIRNSMTEAEYLDFRNAIK